MTTLDARRDGFVSAITATLDSDGIWHYSTHPCYSGWDPMDHHALESIQRHPPEGWHINRVVRWDVHDWTITRE